MDAAQIQAQFETLLEQARADALLPLSDRTRAARLILNHGQFLTTAPILLASMYGQQDILKRLGELVKDLLALCSVTPDGRLEWTQAVPHGRAREVRRVLNEIKLLMDGNGL